MFKRTKNKDYQDYVDYESDAEPFDETREYQVDSSSSRQDWNPNSEYEEENSQEFEQNYDSNHEANDLNNNGDYSDHYSEQSEFDYQDSDDDIQEYSRSRRHEPQAQEDSAPKRTRYDAKMDRFLNNGIIIVGVLLLIVLVIAFML